MQLKSKFLVLENITTSHLYFIKIILFILFMPKQNIKKREQDLRVTCLGSSSRGDELSNPRSTKSPTSSTTSQIKKILFLSCNIQNKHKFKEGTSSRVISYHSRMEEDGDKDFRVHQGSTRDLLDLQPNIILLINKGGSKITCMKPNSNKNKRRGSRTRYLRFYGVLNSP